MVSGRDGQFNWDYSNILDILNIHYIGKKNAGGREFGNDITLDFDEDDRVIGVEVMHAAEHLAHLNITRKQLNNLCSAAMIIEKDGQKAIISIRLHLPGNEKKNIHILTFRQPVEAMV